MARIEEIDTMLWQWAERLKAGDGSGYPTMCTIHPDWSPPSPGVTPTLKVSKGRQGEVDRLVAQLPDSLRATVVAHYFLRMADADAASVLGCAVPTVGQRIVRAHQLLAGMLADRAGIIATTG
jgi:DNA-directed RNA polymerase specialized sigma24 family protein